MRHPKIITNPEDIKYILSLKPNDITKTTVISLFGEFNGKSRFNPYDEITIPKDSYGNHPYMNKKQFITTIGVYLFNLHFISEKFQHVFNGYINKTINGKEFGKINSRLSYALLEDDITTDDMDYFLMRAEKFKPFVSIISPTMTEKMLTCSTVASKKVNELYKNKYKERIDNKDPFAADQLEQEALDYMREYLKGDESMDLYDSGARGSFGNNFKNMFVSKGATKDPDTGEYNIIMSNYMNGISKEDYPTMANALSSGPFGRAKLTALGGYKEKQISSAYQHVTLDKDGSDCHSKNYIEIYLDDTNIDKYMYSYIIDGSTLVELTSKNVSKYLNHVVKMRFAHLCNSKTGYCNKCAGNMFNRLGFKNIGLALAIIASTQKARTMKSFHDSTIKFTEMNPEEAFMSICIIK